MKAFVVFAVVIAIVAGAAVEKKEVEKSVAPAEGEKKQDKRGLWDLGYGYDSHGWDSPLKLSHGWDEPHVTTIIKKEHVPVPYEVEKHVPYPVKVPYPVTVEKHVPVVVEKKVPVYVEKPVAYPVKVPFKVKEYVEVPKPYPVHVEKPYPVYVKKPVVVEKHVPVYVKSHGWEPHSHSYSEFHSYH
ncbi:mantle protein-like [Wyeomyia smithii]|uniref:mantle protein-like n=1 Tax=Wyeomyia smithii TaxID=174621 RepID=UPI0024680E94|nr:mantle protein-like [Wyeomyia smithii]